MHSCIVHTRLQLNFDSVIRHDFVSDCGDSKRSQWMMIHKTFIRPFSPSRSIQTDKWNAKCV